MHVLILPSWYSTPDKKTSGSFFRDQAVALAEQGVKVGLLYPDIRYTGRLFDYPGKNKKLSHYTDAGVQVYTRPTHYLRRGSAKNHSKRMVNLGVQLFSIYVKEQGLPDLIHVHSALYAGGIALEINKRWGLPYVLTEHSTAYARSRIRKNKQQLASQVVAGAARLYAVSSPFASLLSRFFPATEWHPLPNVLDRIFTENHLVVEPTCQERDSFRFLNVCYFSEKKGLGQLISAFAEVARLNPGVHLTLAGDGDLRPRLEQQVADLKLTGRVNFTGLLDRNQVLEAMQACDCFVLSSDYETFGVVLIEALALGKPVIATRCGGPEDIVSAENGLLVPPANSKALAEAMRTLLEQRSDYHAEKIRSGCIEKYGSWTIGARLIEDYRLLLQKESGA